MADGLPPGTIFGPYRIEGLIGRGGMGEVYLAEHVRLQRKVAIKLLAPSLAGEEGFRERFLRESQDAASLEHPNIVAVYDAGEEGGRAYISMRYVEGTDLSRLLRSSGPQRPAEAIGIVAQIAGALDAAHAAGLVHRDVKPANILLEGPIEPDRRPRALLTDFGITKRVGAEGSTTGQFVGTVDYMAPEQITGRPTDGRTDEYSLACVLFQCLTGHVPFERDAQVGVMYAHVQAPPPSAADARPGLPAEIDEVIRRGMAKSRDRRYPSCSQFADAAAAALGVEVRDRPSWPPAGTPTRARSRRRQERRPRTVAVAASLIAAIAVGAASILLWPRAAGPSPHPTTLAHLSASSGASKSLSTSSTPPPPPFTTSIVWEGVPDPGGVIFGGPGDQSINRAVVGPGAVVAVGFDSARGDNQPKVWISPEGLHWHGSDIAPGGGSGPQGMAAVVYLGKRYIAVGTQTDSTGGLDGAFWTSSNGDTWALKNHNNIQVLGGEGDQQVRRVIHFNGGLLAVGWTSAGDDHDAAVWQFADNRWSHPAFTIFAEPGGQEMWNVAQFGSDLYAVGTDDRGGDKDVAIWRYHRRNWKRVGKVDPDLTGPGDQAARGIVAGGPGLIAVGTDDSSGIERAVAWTSVDGEDWTRVELDADESRPGEAVGVVAWRGGLIAVGATGSGTDRDGAVWMSTDGRAWERSADPALGGPGSQYIRGVVTIDGRLVAFGQDKKGDRDAAVWVGTPSA